MNIMNTIKKQCMAKQRPYSRMLFEWFHEMVHVLISMNVTNLNGISNWMFLWNSVAKQMVLFQILQQNFEGHRWKQFEMAMTANQSRLVFDRLNRNMLLFELRFIAYGKCIWLY